MRNSTAASGRYGTINKQSNTNERNGRIMADTNEAAAAAGANGGTAAGGERLVDDHEHDGGEQCAVSVVDALVRAFGVPDDEKLLDAFGLNAQGERIGPPKVSFAGMVKLTGQLMSDLGGEPDVARLLGLGGRPKRAPGGRELYRAVMREAGLVEPLRAAVLAFARTLAEAIEQGGAADVKGAAAEDSDEPVDLGGGRRRFTLGARPFVLIETGDLPEGVDAPPGAMAINVRAGGGLTATGASNLLTLAALGATQGDDDDGDDDEPNEGALPVDEPVGDGEQERPAGAPQGDGDEPAGPTQGDGPAGEPVDGAHGNSGPGGEPLPGVSPAGVEVPAGTGGDAAHAA